MYKLEFFPMLILFIQFLRHNEYVAKGNVLSSIVLQEAMEEIDKQYPNIWDNTDRDVGKLEHQLENLSEMKEHYKSCIQNLEWVFVLPLVTYVYFKYCFSNSEAHAQAIDNVADLNKAINSLSSIEQKSIEDCTNRIIALQDVKLSNQNLVMELVQCYIKPVSFKASVQ